MSDPTRDKLSDWLHYYEDIGISSFYSGRTTQNSIRPKSPRLRVPTTIPPSVSSLANHLAPTLFDSSDRVEGDTLEKIRADIGADCRRCKLCERRTHIVFADGNPNAELVFVGEGPGHDEDVQGIPFVGRAGQLLTQMIEAMGLKRQQVYICNVVKCRPPENRQPEPEEIATCSPFLFRQLEVIKPKVIVGLGAVAVKNLLAANVAITKIRGQWHEFRGMPLMPTYHPAYLLRNPPAKPDAWKDLQLVMKRLGLELPKKK
ncbi:MAG: uracil-DNA glycosylase [Acidobacteria bacterium]|nr:uracil-DNA glycosylase [Acidobacteriota bacterium]